MKELKQKLYKSAQEKYGKISLCHDIFDRNFQKLDMPTKSGKTIPYLLFYFNTPDRSTHVIKEEIG